MRTMASQITSITIVCSTIYSGADQRKHQSSASLTFVRGIHRWPVNSPHKWLVTRKMFPFDDVTMLCQVHVQLLLNHVMLSSPLNLFEDWVPGDEIFGCPTFKWVAKSWLNSLWPSDAIWWQGSRSTLVQVMACCLTAPSHYQNQCWLIITKVQWCSSEGNFAWHIIAISH